MLTAAMAATAGWVTAQLAELVLPLVPELVSLAVTVEMAAAPRVRSVVLESQEARADQELTEATAPTPAQQPAPQWLPNPAAIQAPRAL